MNRGDGLLTGFEVGWPRRVDKFPPGFHASLPAWEAVEISFGMVVASENQKVSEKTIFCAGIPNHWARARAADQERADGK